MALQLPNEQRFDYGLPSQLEAGVVNLLNALVPGIENVPALMSEAWMSDAILALIGFHPTRVYLDSQPLWLDNSPVLS